MHIVFGFLGLTLVYLFYNLIFNPFWTNILSGTSLIIVTIIDSFG